VVRIAALIAIAGWVSPDVAFGGFHSKAGWFLFCALSLLVVAVGRKLSFFSAGAGVAEAERYDDATAAYCAPLLAVLGLQMVTGLFAADIDWLYGARILAAAAALAIYRRRYADIEIGASLRAVAIGAAAFVVWMLLARAPNPDRARALTDQLRDVGPLVSKTWIASRVIGAVVIAPVVEELAFRGYLQRRLVSEDFTEVAQSVFTWPSLVVSAVAFGALHDNWIAGAVCGVLYSVATYGRGKLSDAVVAHATTNALLVVWVLAFGRYDLWL